MNKYRASSPETNAELRETAGAVELAFPIDRDFISQPPRLDPQVMLRRIAQTMPARSARVSQAKRLADKLDVEFVL
jgi:hypothetical protein